MERYPNLKDEVGGLIPGCEISSMLERDLAMQSTASCAFGDGMLVFCLKTKIK